jgi:hypothetical protein
MTLRTRRGHFFGGFLARQPAAPVRLSNVAPDGNGLLIRRKTWDDAIPRDFQ